MSTAEQRAKDMLERAGVEHAQSMTAGDLVEVANALAEIDRLRAEVERLSQPRKWAHCPTHGPEDRHEWGCPNCLAELRAEVDAVRAALAGYHAALNRREHGGVAASEVIRAIEEAVGMRWSPVAAR